MSRNPDSYRRVISDAHKQALSEAHFVHGHAATRQHRHSRTYQSWMSMKERCDDPNHKSYSSYGGRGISYCAEWDDFVNFLADMGERPPGMTLGRRDHKKGYCKDNCEWQTWKAQANNRRSSRWLEFRGERKTLQDWAETIGITSDALGHRLRLGWSVQETLTRPARNQKNSRASFLGQLSQTKSAISHRKAGK